MRLAILDNGHSFGTKALFALIRTVSRQPVLDVVKLVSLRPLRGEALFFLLSGPRQDNDPWGKALFLTLLIGFLGFQEHDVRVRGGRPSSAFSRFRRTR
jgi:hypothetical protein